MNRIYKKEQICGHCGNEKLTCKICKSKKFNKKTGIWCYYYSDCANDHYCSFYCYKKDNEPNDCEDASYKMFPVMEEYSDKTLERMENDKLYDSLSKEEKRIFKIKKEFEKEEAKIKKIIDKKREEFNKKINPCYPYKFDENVFNIKDKNISIKDDKNE